MNQDWLSAGGAYFLLALIWVGAAVGFGVAGIKAGDRVGSPNDGCLLAIGNVVLALLGGGLGFLLMMRFFPYFLLSSLVGAVTLPSLGTLYFLRKTRPS